MKIFIAVDGSECSKAAVDSVARRTWPAGTEIRLVTVVPPLDPGVAESTSATVFDEIVKQRLAEASKRLNDAAMTIRKRYPDLSIGSSLLQGRPKETIVKEAEKWNADLIVLGSHGYGAVQRFFLGSVSLAVATNAHCSVEIVRCPAGAGESSD